jgi:hypothetical protein
LIVHPSIRLEIASDRLRDRQADATRPDRKMSAPSRELAQRKSGTDEVLLLWHPESERVELAIRDLASGAGFHLDVAADSAIDAFYHPYAYLAWAKSPDVAVRADTTTIDG